VLTDIAVRKAIPREAAFKIFDSGGLFLLVTPPGGKLWRMRYKIAKREKLLSFGPHPEVTLTSARDAQQSWLRQFAQRFEWQFCLS
jgi:hypothetical protein